MTVTVSVKLLYLIPAPKASWIPEAPRHFEESQWGPEKRASEESGVVCVYMVSVNEMKCRVHVCLVNPWQIHSSGSSAAAIVPFIFRSECLSVCASKISCISDREMVCIHILYTHLYI